LIKSNPTCIDIWAAVAFEMKRESLSLFLVFVCIVVVETTWSGATYWTSRYSSDGISYSDNSDSGILWNHLSNGRHAYEPSNLAGSSCGSCTCTADVIDCSSASSTVNIYNMAAVKQIKEFGLSSSITRMTIRGTGLETIHQNAFKNLTSLTTL